MTSYTGIERCMGSKLLQRTQVVAALGPGKLYFPLHTIRVAWNKDGLLLDEDGAICE